MMSHIGDLNVALVHQVRVVMLHDVAKLFPPSQMPFVSHVEGFAGYLDKVSSFDSTIIIIFTHLLLMTVVFQPVLRYVEILNMS